MSEPAIDSAVLPLAVETEELNKHFGRRTALDRLSLEVPRGAFCGLVGANGAGKTTTFKVLLDLVRADSGCARVLGLDTQSPLARARAGYVPESHQVGYPWMTVSRLIEHHAVYFSRWDSAYARHLVGALEIDAGALFGTLSKGQARRVQLLLALAHRPPLLLLDEPADGLDPLARDRLLTLLSEHLADSEATVVVATHLAQVFDRFIDHLALIDRGRVVTQVARARLERSLHVFRAGIPEGWPGAPQLDSTILSRRENGREIAWTVWGDEGEVRERLSAAGASVEAVRPLSLEDAILSLLKRPSACSPEGESALRQPAGGKP